MGLTTDNFLPTPLIQEVLVPSRAIVVTNYAAVLILQVHKNYYPACACAARGKVISRGWATVQRWKRKWKVETEMESTNK